MKGCLTKKIERTTGEESRFTKSKVKRGGFFEKIENSGGGEKFSFNARQRDLRRIPGLQGEKRD